MADVPLSGKATSTLESTDHITVVKNKDVTPLVRLIPATDFATASQGSTADSAVQPGDDAADLGSGAAADNLVLTSDGVGGAAWEAGGGGLTNFTEAESQAAPNATVFVDSIKAAGATTNADAAIIPKGTGALLAAIPDSTATGGNKRGANAVDLQMVRGFAAKVASGEMAVIGGGYSNAASGDYSTVTGGGYAIADKRGQVAHSVPFDWDEGLSQYSTLFAANQTSNATPTELFLDGQAASVRCTIATDTTWVYKVTVVGRRTDSDNESFGATYEGVIDNNAGTVALAGTQVATELANDTAMWSVAVTADNTNDSLKITVTGEAGKTIRWVAKIDLTEVSG